MEFKSGVEIARALALKPNFILLDEPAAGLNVAETNTLKQMISTILDRGIGILLVEHNMELIMNVCPRIAVLNYGEKIAEGTPLSIKENEAVVEALSRKEKSMILKIEEIDCYYGKSSCLEVRFPGRETF